MNKPALDKGHLTPTKTQPNADTYETGHKRLTFKDFQAEGSSIVERAYDAWGEDYDEDMVKGRGYTFPSYVANIFRRYVEPKKGQKILDAGAGTGLVGQALVGNGFYPESLYGVDLSKEMLALADRKSVYHTLQQGDLTNLDFEDETFDHLISVGVVGIAPSETLDELLRVTRKKGHILFTLRETIKNDPDGGFIEKMEAFTSSGLWRRVNKVGPVSADHTIQTQYFCYSFEKAA